ncbi:MAG: ribulose-phosphate 3-epimerase [Deltaproteobacteria bacterium]|nr:ribulose-phosphate 3-epimerase [Deltaproteobacteria bacterium]MBW2078249.1 ribulose-phosphate 3-epimerase [Deltaproteobacteria bacterium]
MIAIEASVLSADYLRLGEQVREAQVAGVDGIQVDIMDGRFVPNITFGQGMVRALRSAVSLMLDIHLMIVEPEHYLEEFVEEGADRLFVHYEACTHLHRTLGHIRELGAEAGLAINPATPASVLEEVLDMADIIQVMTVNPGFGGQQFIRSQLDKISRIREMLEKRGLALPIAVDGGVDTTTAPLIVSAGATVLVAGSSIYNDRASVAQNVAALRESIEA